MSSYRTPLRMGGRRIKEFLSLSSSLGAVLWLVALAAIGYFLLIRPTRRRAQEVTAVQSALAVDAEVMLTSGIFGRVTGIEDEQVLVEVSPGVVVRVHRGAIGKVVTPANQLEADVDEVESADDADIDPDARGAN
jgi:preprotein translocase subunit YajC